MLASQVAANTASLAQAALDDFFFTPAELALRWRTHESTLANKRSQMMGLRFVKIDGKVLYRMSDVIRAELEGSVEVGLPRILDAISTFGGLDAAGKDSLAKHIKLSLREAA